MWCVAKKCVSSANFICIAHVKEDGKKEKGKGKRRGKGKKMANVHQFVNLLTC